MLRSRNNHNLSHSNRFTRGATPSSTPRSRRFPNRCAAKQRI